jgi:hypothetical protein
VKKEQVKSQNAKVKSEGQGKRQERTEGEKGMAKSATGFDF